MTPTPSNTSADDELDSLLKAAGVQPTGGRSLLDPYSDLIAAGLRRRPPLSYDQLAVVVNAKLKGDGVVDTDGKPATVTRSGVYAFVSRRRRQAERREGDAQAITSSSVRAAEPTQYSQPAPQARVSQQPTPDSARPAATHKRSSSLIQAGNTGSPATSKLDELKDETNNGAPGLVPGVGKLLK